MTGEYIGRCLCNVVKSRSDLVCPGLFAESSEHGGDDVELVELSRSNAQAPDDFGAAPSQRFLYVVNGGVAQRVHTARDGLQLPDGRRRQRAPQGKLGG